MKVLIFNNISSGISDGAIYDFIRLFSAPNDEIVLRSVDASTDFTAALADASRFDMVVASGGDGTIAEVSYELRYTGVPIMIFPSGTANLISQNILQPIEVPALAKVAREGKTMDFDLGEFDFGMHRQGFMMMAGCGYDAQIMSTANNHKDRLGAVAYFRAAFENPNPTFSHISLDVDGKHYETSGVGLIVMNFSKIQFDVSFGLANLPSDGLLDVCVLATKNAWELLPSALGAALDRSGKALEQSDALQYFRGQEIQVTTKPRLNVEYDGEATSFTTPFTVRALPKAVRLVVSDECIEEFSR
ncbi:MAG: NAD(+)/NADH kinase [Eggerthellaceae bacterium]|nr:NAD(+)/NADH kinase [Eggerthellaceae bacterium]